MNLYDNLVSQEKVS